MTYQIPKIMGEHTCEFRLTDNSIGFADNRFGGSANAFLSFCVVGIFNSSGIFWLILLAVDHIYRINMEQL